MGASPNAFISFTREMTVVSSSADLQLLPPPVHPRPRPRRLHVPKVAPFLSAKEFCSKVGGGTIRKSNRRLPGFFLLNDLLFHQVSTDKLAYSLPLLIG